MHKVNFFISVVFIFSTSSYSAKLPSFITPCRHDLDNEALSQCILGESRRVLKEFSRGIPELGVESLDPLHVADYEISAASVTIKHTNVVVTGSSKHAIKEIKLNMETGRGRVVTYGNVTATSEYDINGRLLLLPVTGHGKFKVKMENTEIAIDFKLKLIAGPESKQHYHIYDVEPSHTIGNARLRMEGLFGNDPLIGRSINQVINENWRELMKDFGPPSVKAVTKNTVKIINSFFAAVPYDDLFAY